MREGVPRIGRVTEAPGARDFGGDAAAFQVIARGLRGLRLEELALKPGGGIRVQREQPAPHTQARIVLRGHLLLDDADARALGQPPHRRAKFEMLIEHHEIKDAAAR